MCVHMSLMICGHTKTRAPPRTSAPTRARNWTRGGPIPARGGAFPRMGVCQSATTRSKVFPWPASPAVGNSRNKVFTTHPFRRPACHPPNSQYSAPMLSGFPAPTTTPEAPALEGGFEALERSFIPLPGGNNKQKIQKIRYTHDAMIDLIIENPMISQNELADIFGRGKTWVSIVVNSDAFQARLAQRKAEIVDPSITATVRERFVAIAERSQQVLLEKLAKPSDSISDNFALRAAEMAAKALGEGGHAPPTPPSDHLSTLAARLLSLGAHTPPKPLEYIDVVESHSQGGPSHEPNPSGPSDPGGEAGLPSGASADAGVAPLSPLPDRPVGGEPGGQNPPPSVTP